MIHDFDQIIHYRCHRLRVGSVLHIKCLNCDYDRLFNLRSSGQSLLARLCGSLRFISKKVSFHNKVQRLHRKLSRALLHYFRRNFLLSIQDSYRVDS